MITYQLDLTGTPRWVYRVADFMVGFDICRGVYPDHIKGAYPDGGSKGFLQKEAWEVRLIAEESTVETIRQITNNKYW